MGEADVATVRSRGAVHNKLKCRVAPAHIRGDNRTEFVSVGVQKLCANSGAGTLHIEPESPWQIGIVGSFNGHLQDELISSEIFATLA